MSALALVSRVRLTRVHVKPSRSVGTGFGHDAEGRPASFTADTWTLLRQSDALASGHAVEVYVFEDQAIAWRRA